MQFFGCPFGASHVHLKVVPQSVRFQNAHMLGAGAGQDRDFSFRDAGVNQECRGATRAISRHLNFTAVGIKQPDLCIVSRLPFWRKVHNEPAIGAGTRMPVANGDRRCPRIFHQSRGRPREQKIVFGAMRLGEWNPHEMGLLKRLKISIGAAPLTSTIFTHR